MSFTLTEPFGAAPCPSVDWLDDKRIFTIPGLLTEAQCARLREWATEQTWETEAPITTSRGFVKATDVRNNERLIVDDHGWAANLWARVSGVFEQILPGAVGVNERFRFYRYRPGQYFKDHFDGAFHRPATFERSVYTLMLYLSDVEEGGHTRFYDAELTVAPMTGMACAFVHQQLHAGETVVRGLKWVLRTDVMFDLRHLAHAARHP